ncbi:putative transcriptional regulator [Beggiatoa alba B18LD]|uniref:Putative transcriptional regulator n=1 Tax=Beggiatoa alba B18LD TaxID=395493 RepID=I3CJN5_9GAMM|nr:helix-turn-helix domain-containing protein [Beggiatoa alba]EIJ43828.1 putative transcriptional regulator [Beggiatoa alba B18LD]
MNKSILETVHEIAKDLHAIGVMQETTLREFDAICLPTIQEYTAEQIKLIRLRHKVSQRVFASYLNISKSAVQKWEQGKKKPNNSSLKLLNLVDTKGLDILA